MGSVMKWRNQVFKEHCTPQKPNIRERRICSYFNGQVDEESGIRSFSTRALILTPKGMISNQKVKIDERSSSNLIPLSIATDLDLLIIPKKPTASQYCQFNVRLADVERTINAEVIPGLCTILLGQQWIQSVHLLNSHGNQIYYIPVPLNVEATKRNSPGGMNTNVKDIEDEITAVNEQCHNDRHDVDNTISYDMLSVLERNLLSSERSQKDGKGKCLDNSDDNSLISELLLDDGDDNMGDKTTTSKSEDKSNGEPSDRISEQERAKDRGHSTNSQAIGAQTLFTKRQSKEIIKMLDCISLAPTGQSFRKPVRVLWPEFASIYDAKIRHPVDLSTMKMKVKNKAYYSIDEIKTDAILLYQNSVEFNGPDHIITSAAIVIRDTIFEAINGINEGRETSRVSTRGQKT